MTIISYLRHLLHLTPHYDPTLTIRNLAYFDSNDAHVNHKMDIFLPAVPATSSTTENQLPVVVHVHGGGWVRGSRIDEGRGGPTVGRTVARHGYVGVVVSYRLARISLLSYLAWSFIFGLIIIIVGAAILSWQLVVGYLICMIGVYLYHLLFQVRSPVHIEHVRNVRHATPERFNRTHSIYLDVRRSLSSIDLRA